MHENRINGKRYIGITSQKPTNRWGNGHGYKRCPFFYASILKYGWDTFRHEILYTNLTQDDAEKLEIELIAKYETQNPDKGYNLSSGGGVNSGFHRSEEFKQKVSETRKLRYSGKNHNRYGTHLSEETKKKIRDAQIGKPRKSDSCKKMSESAKKRWSSDNVLEREHLKVLNSGKNSPKAKAVRCIETGKIYSTITEASKNAHIDNSCIVRCCKGNRNTAGGYHWKYVKAVVDDE